MPVRLAAGDCERLLRRSEEEEDDDVAGVPDADRVAVGAEVARFPDFRFSSASSSLRSQ